MRLLRATYSSKGSELNDVSTEKEKEREGDVLPAAMYSVGPLLRCGLPTLPFPTPDSVETVLVTSLPRLTPCQLRVACPCPN